MSGAHKKRIVRSLAVTAAGLGAALPGLLYLWHFMVDDALISARYAANIATGAGYRFNAGGAVTDGVTPLGWAYLLAPFASQGALAALQAAKVIGAGAWLAAAAGLAHAIDSLEVGQRKWAALLLIATSAPMAAWSCAGMETGLVLAFAAGAVSLRVLRREHLAMVLVAAVAAWRPEAVPWAVAMALVPLPGPPDAAPSRWLRLAIAITPCIAVALLRLAVFGHAVPLAAVAKPSDISHGIRYALACLLLTGPLAVVAWRGLPPWVRGLQAATLVHFGAMAVAGGDWMPLSRLAVVALPGVAVTAGYIAGHAAWPAATARLAIALAGQLYAFVQVGPAAAVVWPRRLAVIEQLREPLAEARSVAALDIGWVGAATEAAVVDLAGVTDPAIAALPGGHTTKRLPPALLDTRDVDTIVLQLAKKQPLATPWPQSSFARVVELRIASIPAMAIEYSPVAVSEGPLRYVVLRRVKR